MSKAYDRLGWNFILGLLSLMGLSDHWKELIAQCITTVSYAWMLNESSTTSF